ncbi:MAG: TPM domain-containing protein [Pelobacteraceae bacterium]
MNLRYLLLICALVLFPGQLVALDAPPLSGRVNDLARMLSPESLQRLEQKLAAFERETSNQVVVLTVPTLQGDDIDQFSIRVADAWKIGQKGRDNGVLLIIAQAERKVRIEVGMGLQGVLPDITAGRIIRDTMRPYMKDNNYDQGIAAGVDSIIAATKGEFKGTGQPARHQAAKKSAPSFLTMLLGAVVAVAVLGLFSRYLGGAAGAVGFPLATYLAFPGLGLVTLLLLEDLLMIIEFPDTLHVQQVSALFGHFL